MKVVLSGILYFLLASNLMAQIYYPMPDNYDENDPKTHLYDDGKGNTITWNQLSKSKQNIELINYEPYKQMPKPSLDKIGFNGKPMILYFYSKYCGACFAITPIIQSYKSKVKVITIAGTGHPMDDEKDNIHLKNYFQKHINYTPTIWFINKKGQWKQKIGLGPEETKEVINKFLNEK